MWEDDEEEKINVDIVKVGRLRKLRKKDDKTVILGSDYISRLRAQHIKLNPIIDWAKLEFFDIVKITVDKIGPLVGRKEKSLQSFEVSHDSNVIAFVGDEVFSNWPHVNHFRYHHRCLDFSSGGGFIAMGNAEGKFEGLDLRGRELELGRRFYEGLLWEVILEASARQRVVRLIAEEEIEEEDVMITGDELIRVEVDMETLPAMEASTSGRSAESKSIVSDSDDEVEVIQFLDFPGKLVSYSPISDVFREFCKAKTLVGGRWGNFVEHAGRQFRSCIAGSGENSTGQMWDDNVIWVKGDYLQKDDDEPMALLYRTVKKSPQSKVKKESLLDIVAQEGVEFEAVTENRLDREDELKSIEGRVRLASRKGVEEMNKVAARLIKGICLEMEDKAELKSGRGELENKNLDGVVVLHDRLGRHLLKMGYSKAEVNEIMKDTYMEEEKDEDDRARVVRGDGG
ncbi:hypothetical protein GIB67_028920 [Kingdonia uniflora]|uniref:Uncharacterized protein n=1 Tax=Kingdonia uniflora TaxID=39325 RepID=A0A7J7LC69_9MAGN|nr:hypothetical protein GIB67_028920 [Kingdonia uniflora]